MSEAKRIPHNKLEINEKFIIDNYMTMTSFEIAEALGVTRSTINHRIRALGLRKTSIPFIQEDGEILKVIPFAKGYAATSKSRIVKLSDMTLIKPRLKKGGYAEVCFHIDGRAIHRRLHKILADLFVENPEGFPVVNHKDGNKHNYDINNLEWTTAKGNAEHALNTGLLRVGEDAAGAKITEEQARAIINASESGLSNAEIRKKFPFATKSIVEKIVSNKSWKHIERATTSRKA